MDWDTHTKNTIRNIVCKETKEPYLSVLLLPSGMCLDVKQMLSNKAIDLDTRIVAVERDRLMAGVIRGKLQDLGFNNFEVHQKDLHEVDLSKESFDFIYLDTCGNLSPQLLGWMVEQVQTPAFKKTKSINLAFCSSYRQQGLIKHFSKFMTKNKIKSIKTKEKLMGLTADKNKFQIKEHKATATMLAMLFGAVEESFIYRNSNKGAPMHVFTFNSRKLNIGITPMIKFLKTLGIEPKITRAGIKAALKRKGVNLPLKVKPPKPVKGRKERRDKGTSKFNKEQIIESYKRLGSSYRVAEELGVSQSTVVRFIRELGLPRNKVNKFRTRTDIDLEKVKDVLSKGLLWKKSAELLNLPVTTLKDFCRRHELKTDLRKQNVGSKKHTTSSSSFLKFQEALADNSLTMEEAAQIVRGKPLVPSIPGGVTTIEEARESSLKLPPPCDTPLPKFMRKDSLAKVREDLHNILKRLEVLENDQEITYV